MLPRTQVIGVLIAVFMLFVVLELVRRRRLRIGYSLVWLMIGVGATALIAFPWLVRALSRLVGIADPRSLLFTAGIAFALYILLDHSLTITKLWRQDKDLAQKHALLEWQVRDLQARLEELTLDSRYHPAEPQPAPVAEWAAEAVQEPASQYALVYQAEDGSHE